MQGIFEQPNYFVPSDYVMVGAAISAADQAMVKRVFEDWTDYVLRVAAVNDERLVELEEIPGRWFGQAWFDHVTPQGVVVTTSADVAKARAEGTGVV